MRNVSFYLWGVAKSQFCNTPFSFALNEMASAREYGARRSYT